MEVRAGRHACHPNLADDLPGDDLLADRHLQRRIEMGI